MSATPDTHILQTQLAALSAARTPLHMPGHKRRVCPAPGLPHDWDLTEIDGADDLHGADIVFVATDDEDVNARAYRDASEAHLMVNVADRPELCTFFLPSVLRRGKLSIAVSTEGASPLTARRLRRELEERIPAGFEAYLDLLAAWRPRAIAALPDEPARLRFWQQATDGRVQRLVQAADEGAAERLLEELLEAERTACATL